ncbi:MAG: MOSC domain-containing protein, partial [Ilumatobacteraceae bacterium]
MQTELRGVVRAVCAGKRAEIAHGRRTVETAFIKDAIEGRIHVGTLGLAADDHVYEDHGGPDMALLAYPYEHYPHWRSVGLDLPEHGALGENLTVVGLP